MGEKENIELYVAIDGEGLGLDDVDVRHLAELLSATAGLLEAVSEQAGVKAPTVSLRRTQTGSAVYALGSDSPTWPSVELGFYDAVRTRGAKSTPRVRNALGRLYRAAKIGFRSHVGRNSRTYVK